MIEARAHVEACYSVVLLPLDTLRFDVAHQELLAGYTLHLANLLDQGGWQLRHGPGSFTYAAHRAFFAGFLPNPRATLGSSLPLSRSETTASTTCTFEKPDVVTGLAARGYHYLVQLRRRIAPRRRAPPAAREGH